MSLWHQNLENKVKANWHSHSLNIGGKSQIKIALCLEAAVFHKFWNRNFIWPVAPNDVWPNAGAAPNPGACDTAGVPKAGGADVAGVLKEKFPKAANGMQVSKHSLNITKKAESNTQSNWREFFFLLLTLCRCARSDRTRITKIKTHCAQSIMQTKITNLFLNNFNNTQWLQTICCHWKVYKKCLHKMCTTIQAFCCHSTKHWSFTAVKNGCETLKQHQRHLTELNAFRTHTQLMIPKNEKKMNFWMHFNSKFYWFKFNDVKTTNSWGIMTKKGELHSQIEILQNKIMIQNTVQLCINTSSLQNLDNFPRLSAAANALRLAQAKSAATLDCFCFSVQKSRSEKW